MDKPQIGREFLLYRYVIKNLYPRCTKTSYNYKKINTHIWKTGKGFRHFIKENVKMANRHRKRCLTSLVMGEIQFGSTMRYKFIELSNNWNPQNTVVSVGEGGGDNLNFYYGSAASGLEEVPLLWRSVWPFLINSIFSWVLPERNENKGPHNNLHLNMYSSFIQSSRKLETTQPQNRLFFSFLSVLFCTHFRCTASCFDNHTLYNVVPPIFPVATWHDTELV